MNNQTKTQENVKKALAKQTLGLPLTPHEHALVTLYGQSPVQQKENKPEFVEKYLKPLVVALGVGVVNVVYRKTSEHDEIVTLIYENGFTTDKDVSADSLSARGKADNEILEDCGIFCEIAARKIEEAADNGGN